MTTNTKALLRGASRENDAHDEAKADRYCDMGVGCGAYGACYAAANGEPERCSLATHPAPTQPEQAKGGEAVAWLYVENGEVMFGHPNGYRPSDARPLVFGDTHPAPAASVSDEREAFEAEMRCEEVWGHRSLVKRPDGRYQNWQVDVMWDVWQARAALRTAQAGVPDDIVKDAERYRWLRDDLNSDWAICEWSHDLGDEGYYRDARAPHIIDAAIDTAIRARSKT